MDSFSPAYFTFIINQYLPEPQASLLNGIIFGVNLRTSKEFYSQLQHVGLLHLVVLSGTNIALLTALVAKATSVFSKVVSCLITILFIIFFIIFVGPQAPIIRAGFMGSLTLVAIIFGRKNLALYSLLLSLIFIAFFWPAWMSSLSLQLSYAATLGIILFGKVPVNRIALSKIKWINELFRFIIADLWISLSAQILTVPIIFIRFRQISIIAPVANIMVSFMIGPLMVLGFLTSILGKLHISLGLIPSYICYGLLTYMVAVIRLLSRIPFSFFQL